MRQPLFQGWIFAIAIQRYAFLKQRHVVAS